MSLRITFDASARDFVLDAFGKTIDNGYVVERCQPSQKVLTPRGEDIPEKEFAGVRKGSAIFVKSDIISLIEAAKVIELKTQEKAQA
jgi:hypothetical protein